MSASRPIGEIAVEGRYRAELGDLDGLCESIGRLGLLHPIVVRGDGRLVAGARRLEACRRLGWESVPVTVVESLDSAEKLLTAEGEENTCRLDMNPSEKARLGMALEKLERPKAEARQNVGRPPKNGTSEESPEVPGGHPQVRDIVGPAVGMSGYTYQRAKAVVKAAEDDTLPPEQRQVATEALAQMDATGKVEGAFNKIVHPQGNVPVAALTTERARNVANANRKRAWNLISAVSGAGLGAPSVKVAQVRAIASPEEIHEMSKVLGEALTILRHFQRQIKGEKP